MNLMKIVSLLMLGLLLAGCASNGSRYGAVDRITPEELNKLMPAPIATVSLDEIVADSKQGKSPEEIIAKIKASNSRYELTPSQNLALSKEGVDIKVLDYIHQSNESAKQNAIAEEINKREKAKWIAEERLQQERQFAHDRFYDPFWGPPYGPLYGYPYYGNPYLAPHWGFGFGYRHYPRH